MNKVISKIVTSDQRPVVDFPELDARIHVEFAGAFAQACHLNEMRPARSEHLYKVCDFGSFRKPHAKYVVATQPEWTNIYGQLLTNKRLPTPLELEREHQRRRDLNPRAELAERYNSQAYENLPVHEITWAAQAGFTKTPEQMQLIQEEAFENGHKETLRDCKAGLYAKSDEIYNATQVKMLISDAIRKHNETTAIMLKHLKGRYDLPADVDQMIQDLELAGKEAQNG